MIVVAVRRHAPADRWSGGVAITTYGQSRVDLPLAHSPARGGTAVLLSILNLDGELVLRAELEEIVGPIADACRAYGFDRIW
jgi:hypothetical protein